MKALFYIILYLSVNTSVFAEVNVDSLKKKAGALSGIQKADYLNKAYEAVKGNSLKDRFDFAMIGLKYSEQINYLKGIGESNLNVGLALYDMEKYNEIPDRYRTSLEIFKKLKDSVRIGLVYSNTGNLYEKFGKYDSAFIFHKIALGIFQRSNQKKEMAISLNNIGLIIWRNGAFSEALPYFTKALEIRQELKLNSSVAITLNNIGSLYWRQGNYEKALEYFQKSLQMKEQIDDKKGIIISLNNIGLVFQKLKFSDKAYEYFNEALKKSENLNYTYGKAYSLHNIGVFYDEKGDNKTSLSYNLKSLDNYSAMKEFSGIASSLNAIGKNYENLSSFMSAIQYYNKSYNIALSGEDRFAQSQTLENLGRVYYKLKEYQKSIGYLDKSLSIASSQGLKELIKDNYFVISDNYFKLKDYKKAYEYRKLYDDLKDTLYTEKLINDVANWRAKNEVEKQIKENNILKKENESKQSEIDKQTLLKNFMIAFSLVVLIFIVFIYRLYHMKKINNIKIVEQKNELEKLNSLLDSQNKELNEINNTKDKLFSIIGHDLKNPFQALIGFSEILYGEVENIKPEKIRQYSKNINESSKNLLALTRNLLDWARIQSDKISFLPEELAVKELVDDLINVYRFNSEQKNITITNEISEEMKAFADRHMLNTVLRNLISNAVKFTDVNGSIKTSAEIISGKICFSVQDNGIGLTQEEAEKLFNIKTNFSKSGTNKETGTGLGLILCRDFIEKSGGKIWVETELGKGSKFRFTIPG
jgi:signal transduction histidine kinase/Tfp pilus assembly protein PilF